MLRWRRRFYLLRSFKHTKGVLDMYTPRTIQNICAVSPPDSDCTRNDCLALNRAEPPSITHPSNYPSTHPSIYTCKHPYRISVFTKKKMSGNFPPTWEKKTSAVRNTGSILLASCFHRYFHLSVRLCLLLRFMSVWGEKQEEFSCFPFFLSGSSGNLNSEVHISEIERYNLVIACSLLCGHEVLYSLSSIAPLQSWSKRRVE